MICCDMTDRLYILSSQGSQRPSSSVQSGRHYCDDVPVGSISPQR